MTNKQTLWEQQLKEGLQKLEDWHPSESIDLHKWEHIIINERREQKKRLLWELGLLWLFGGIMIVMSLIAFVQLPVLIISVQFGALVGFPVFGWFKYRKKVTST